MLLIHYLIALFQILSPTLFDSPQTSGPACTATVTAENQGTITRLTALPDTLGGPTTTDANTALVVILEYDGSNSASVSGCSWNGVAMTEVGTPANNTTATSFSSLWYLMNAATGSHAFTCTNSTVTEFYLGQITFHNVNASTPIRAGSYQTSVGSGNRTLTISSNTQDLAVSGIESSTSVTGSNQGAGTFTTSGSGNQAAGQGYGAAASTVNFIWTNAGNAAAAGASMQCK